MVELHEGVDNPQNKGSGLMQNFAVVVESILIKQNRV